MLDDNAPVDQQDADLSKKEEVTVMNEDGTVTNRFYANVPAKKSSALKYSTPEVGFSSTISRIRYAVKAR